MCATPDPRRSALSPHSDGRAWRRSVLLAVALAMAACGSQDPLETARARQQAGDLRGSLEPLREVLAEHPDDPEVDYLYGRALAGTGQWSLAEWSLQEAMKDPEWLVPAGMLLADGALRTLNLPLAIQATTRVLEVEPENVEALMMRANAYAHQREEPELALQDVERIFELEPDYIDAMEPKILALIALERFDDAEAALDELGERIEKVEIAPEMAGWYCATDALFTEESGEVEEAEAKWARCVEDHPTHPDVVSNALKFYDSRGDYARGLEILQKAHEERPASREYRVVLGHRLRLLGRGDEAEALLLEAAEQEHPELAPQAWTDLVKHYQDLEQYHEAADAAGRALEAGKRSGHPLPELQFEYADALMIDGRYDESLAVVEEMTVPAHQELIRARVAQEQGQYQKALEHFSKGFQLWPNNAFARYYAALAAEDAGDFERAVQEYRYAIRIDPASTDSRVRVTRLHMAEGQLPAALQLIGAGDVPLEPEGAVVSAELFGMAAQDAAMRRVLTTLQQEAPQVLGSAVAHAARGVSRRSGAEAALALLRQFEKDGLPFSMPLLADALRERVRLAHEVGQLEAAEALVASALAEHPDTADFHEIQGLALALRGEQDEARAAYARALEHDPSHVRALVGLGRLALAAEPERALERFEQALALDATDAEALRGAAEALVALERGEEAEARLDALLDEHPYDAQAAARQAELQLARGTATDATLERARRAVRFGGGADALELLSRVHRQRGEIELADQSAERARQLRSRGGADPAADFTQRKSSS